MNNIFEFEGFRPVVHESAFVHPNATITGNVIIGAMVYVGAGSVIRGDWGEIVLAEGCNVQENCTIHTVPGVACRLEEDAHVGHGAVIHAAKVGRNALIGMNAVLMHHVNLGEECIVGALSFVPSQTRIPARKLLVGNPARVIKDVSDEMIRWKSQGTALYQQLPERLSKGLTAVSPLREVPKNRPVQPRNFRTWDETKQDIDFEF